MRSAPLIILAIAAPAQAAQAQLPEPSNLSLMAVGLVGLVTGRYLARKRRARDKD